MEADPFYAEILGVESMLQLNDQPCDVSRKQQLGFPIPQEDTMTAYRQRMLAGDYEAKTKPKPEQPKTTRKRATAKRRTKT